MDSVLYPQCLCTIVPTTVNITIKKTPSDWVVHNLPSGYMGCNGWIKSMSHFSSMCWSSPLNPITPLSSKLWRSGNKKMVIVLVSIQPEQTVLHRAKKSRQWRKLLIKWLRYRTMVTEYFLNRFTWFHLMSSASYVGCHIHLVNSWRLISPPCPTAWYNIASQHLCWNFPPRLKSRGASFMSRHIIL